MSLRHLVNEGMGENTLRALTSDLAYLQAWPLAATGKSLPWPAPEALLLKFVAHHLWDPQRRQEDPLHGMPHEVAENLRNQGFLKSTGPHAPDTVRRRLAHLVHPDEMARRPPQELHLHFIQCTNPPVSKEKQDFNTRMRYRKLSHLCH